MIIRIKAKPNSREDKIEKISEEDYVISVKERAEKGKANCKIAKLLAKEFNVETKKIKIKNPSSRNKIIEID